MVLDFLFLLCTHEISTKCIKVPFDSDSFFRIAKKFYCEFAQPRSQGNRGEAEDNDSPGIEVGVCLHQRFMRTFLSYL